MVGFGPLEPGVAFYSRAEKSNGFLPGRLFLDACSRG
jgi:hypothetical protein